MKMNRELLLQFRANLLDRRRDTLERVRELEARWQEISERPIEIEEEAQRDAITLQYDRVDDNGFDIIEQIDLALKKISMGEYGICEHCGDDISLKRLEAVPWARLCIDCAREFERKNQVLPPPGEAIESTELPDEYQGLSNNQILSIINKQIKKQGRIDTNELEISIRNGVVYLEGVVGGEPERQVLVQLLTDVLGFPAVVDRLSANEVVFEREDRTPGRKNRRAGTIEDRLFYDEEELDEDLFDAGDEKPYSPPENPLPEPEYGRHGQQTA